MFKHCCLKTTQSTDSVTFLRVTDANIQYKVVKQYKMLRKNNNYMDSYLSNAVFTNRLLRHVDLFSRLIPIEGLNLQKMCIL